MLSFKDSRISAAVQIVNAIFIIFFMFWSLPVSVLKPDAGCLLQLLLIILLIFWRRNRPKALFFIPDDLLVCLPMLWALANAGSASAWFALWAWPYILSFSLSMLWLVFCSGNPARGLKNNHLYHATAAFAIFVACFIPFLGTFFPEFAETLAGPTLLNLAVLFMIFPISLAGLNILIADSASEVEHS